MATMVVIVVIAVWITIGMVIGLVEARHGHWSKMWVLGVILGPLLIPLAVQARRGEVETGSRPIGEGQPRAGEFDVLVGIDGSAPSVAAAITAADWFGPRLGRLTLAAVLDFDTATPHDDSLLHPGPWAEEAAAEAALQATVRMISEQRDVQSAAVLLAGRPADALDSYALEHGFDAVAVGRRGRGLSKALLGSCASQLAGRTHLPVLLVPDPGTTPPGSAAGGHGGTAAVMTEGARRHAQNRTRH